MNLGLAYSDRIKGERAENMEKAIDIYYPAHSAKMSELGRERGMAGPPPPILPAKPSPPGLVDLTLFKSGTDGCKCRISLPWLSSTTFWMSKCDAVDQITRSGFRRLCRRGRRVWCLRSARGGS